MGSCLFHTNSPVVIGNQLTLAPSAIGERTRNETHLVNLELITWRSIRSCPAHTERCHPYPIQRRRSRGRARAITVCHVNHDGAD